MSLHGFAMDALVERRIEAAIARGEFDDLPGAGKPLRLDDDPLVPPELRMACRLLKNAGCLPPELQQVSEVHQLVAAICREELPAEGAPSRRLRALLVHLELSGRPATAQGAWQRYAEALRARCGRGR